VEDRRDSNCKEAQEI